MACVAQDRSDTILRACDRPTADHAAGRVPSVDEPQQSLDSVLLPHVHSISEPVEMLVAKVQSSPLYAPFFELLCEDDFHTSNLQDTNLDQTKDVDAILNTITPGESNHEYYSKVVTIILLLMFLLCICVSSTKCVPWSAHFLLLEYTRYDVITR